MKRTITLTVEGVLVLNNTYAAAKYLIQIQFSTKKELVITAVVASVAIVLFMKNAILRHVHVGINAKIDAFRTANTNLCTHFQLKEKAGD